MAGLQKKVEIKRFMVLLLIAVMISSSFSQTIIDSIAIDTADTKSDKEQNLAKTVPDYKGTDHYNRQSNQDRGVTPSVNTLPLTESESPSGRKLLPTPKVNNSDNGSQSSDTSQNVNKKIGKTEKKILLATGAVIVITGVVIVLVKLLGKDKNTDNEELIPDPPSPPEF